ncbi:hypothetical protein N7530_008317 [Penicillium desertorum]|uniref:NmrA-like domain-containing protein n=1 Tax=Penicillium desertorum TaxID=1303715 RepID=A0A9X0BKS8_9EURO|nr:hypothetical protein N7530_008317 [Penicillium desertorum]
MFKTILVTGATGTQGGAVIRAIAALPRPEFTILALTRDINSQSSKKLVKKYPSVKLVTGDLNTPDEIFKAIDSPVWGVFSVQTPFGKAASLESEVTQGKGLVNAALRNNVKHFVYSSVDRGGPRSDKGEPSPVPHFETKRQIEDHLRLQADNSEMRYAILRPAFFMENLTDDMQGRLIAAAWRMSVDPKRLQLVATSDIGHFAAQAFAKPDEYAGRAISIAGDELTHEEASSIWQIQTGCAMPTGSSFLAWALLRAIRDLRFMFRWFREAGYGADISLLRREHPGLQNFETWVSLNKKEHKV